MPRFDFPPVGARSCAMSLRIFTLAAFTLALGAPAAFAGESPDSAPQARPLATPEPAPTVGAVAPAPVSPHPYECAVGIRYGYPVSNDFAFWEIYGAWSPEGWYCDLNKDFRARIGLTAGIGALRADNNDLAFFFHAGPIGEIVHRPSGIRLVGRSEPSYMSRHALGGHDLGEDFQFVSALGLFWTPPGDGHWTFGAAIQHISNAGISNVNPGTNHVVVSLAYAF